MVHYCFFHDCFVFYCSDATDNKLEKEIELQRYLINSSLRHVMNHGEEIWSEMSDSDVNMLEKVRYAYIIANSILFFSYAIYLCFGIPPYFIGHTTG